jgi:predicted GNAT family N-acyltransferase
VFTVNASLDARAFYEKLGFDAVSGPLNREGVIAIPMTLSVGA